MGLLDAFRRPTPLAESQAMVPAASYAAAINQLEVLTEAATDAGLRALEREDRGWARLGAQQDQQFTRDGLLNIQRACLAAFLGSPLIGRGVRIRRNYVWGRGVEIAARETVETSGDTSVNDLVQSLVDSPEFQRTLGSAQAREERETNLATAGEFFVLAVHERPAGSATRTVRPRLVPPAQMVEYIANPDDTTEVWFYKRSRTVHATDVATGRQISAQVEEWHPTLDYRPPLRDRLDLIGMKPVRWDAPVLHCAVNSHTDAPWGLPDVWAAIDWARGYADYLSSWAGLMKSLARYAYKATAPAKHAPKVARAMALGQGTNPITGRPTDDVGAAAIMSPGTDVAPMHSAGATINADSGKPLAGMAAAALDVPLTMLLADPGTTGARAVAETLDRPLELTTGARQQLWTDWLKALFAHVLLVAVEDGALPGVVTQYPTRQTLDLDATVDVTFPPIADMSLAERLQAITMADGLPIPPLLIVRMALEALGVEDIDEVIEKELTDGRGNFVDPRIAQQVAALQREQDGAPGSQAAEAYR